MGEEILKSEFVTNLVGEYLDDDKNFKLTQDLVYYSELLCKMITVPKYFISDFSSVPRVPIAFMFFGGKAHHESVIHDALYFTAITTRKKSDEVFLEAMKVRDKGWFVRYSMFIGVRAGGMFAWNNHRKLGHPK